MRRASLIVSALAVLAGAAGLLASGGSAQAPPPTLTITLTPTTAVVEPTVAPSGPTRVVFRNASPRLPVEATLVALRPGRTLDDLRTALRSSQPGPGPLKSVVTFEAGGFVRPGGTYVTTIDLRPGEYVAASPGEEAECSPLTPFTVSPEPGGGTRAEPAATIELFDYAFGMAGTLPRRGTIRLAGRGEHLHIAVAFPLRRGANRTTALRALLANNERRFNRLADQRRGIELLGVVSGGTVNDVEADFGRPGNWVLACFLSDGEPGNPPHNTIGMVRAFRVR